MRLHSLTLTAIGPFAGTEHIDFDALAADGLFLFAGPTGSGKTTVLDAVTYAVYGSLPGTRAGHTAKIKSDHVPPDVRPEIVLECTIGGERVRLTRSPAYQRPAKRGGGLTEQRAAVYLERYVDGTWTGVEGGRREAPVQDWLRERLGLSAEQFTQVILLPQGQFAQFLHSTDSDRERVLRTLFRADRFTAVEDWLTERHKERAEQARVAGEHLDRLKHRVQMVAGLADDDLPEIPSEAWFDSLVTSRRERLGAERSAAAAAATGVRDRSEALRKAQRVAELQAARSTARQLLDRARDRSGSIERDRERLAAAHDAAGVARIIELMDEAENRHRSAAERLAAARRRLSSIVPEADSTVRVAEQDGAALRSMLQRLVRDRAALARPLDAETALAGLAATARQAQGAAAEAAAELERLRAHLCDLPARVSAVQEQIGPLSLRAGRLGAAEAEERRQRAAYDAAVQVTRLESQLGAADEALTAAIDLAQRARERYLDLQERRIAAMAGELAAALVPGEPCAVCGSTRHPQPVTTPAETPTPQRVAVARRAADEAEAKRPAALARRSELAERLAALRAAAAGRSESDAARALEDAIAARVDAADAADALDEARGRLAELQATLDEAAQRVETATVQAAEADRAYREARGAQQRARAEVDAARGTHRTVSDRAAEVDESIAAIEDLLALQTDAEAAERAAADHAAAAARTATDQGFTSVAEARAGILDADAVLELRTAVQRHDAELARAEATLANPEFTALPDAPPDIQALQAALATATAEDRTATVAVARSVEALDDLAVLQSRVLDEAAELAAAEREAARVRELALLIRGQGANEKRMSLTSYFLSARLEQVTDIASAHLSRMTAGRYSLLHTDQRATRRGSGGLGLVVLDAHTGIARSPRTLSGGETFAASLALALALAEVVTSEAGGMTVNSLFIDEGFGALDLHYLDDAMGVLEDLRATGRIIGVVSHVDELRQRISAQLVIERAETGSRILRTTGSALPHPSTPSRLATGA